MEAVFSQFDRQGSGVIDPLEVSKALISGCSLNHLQEHCPHSLLRLMSSYILKQTRIRGHAKRATNLKTSGKRAEH